MAERIKLGKNNEKKAELETRRKLHMKLAKGFFKHLKITPNDTFLLSSDCQKNLVLTKVTDQSAYYSRQLYCYNMAVVKDVSTDALTPENVSLFTWTENESRKSCNEIASIVLHEIHQQACKDIIEQYALYVMDVRGKIQMLTFSLLSQNGYMTKL